MPVLRPASCRDDRLPDSGAFETWFLGDAQESGGLAKPCCHDGSHAKVWYRPAIPSRTYSLLMSAPLTMRQVERASLASIHRATREAPPKRADKKNEKGPAAARAGGAPR